MDTISNSDSRICDEDNLCGMQKNSTRRVAKIISVLIIVLFSSFFIINIVAVEIAYSRPITVHENKIEISLYYSPSFTFSPLGIRYLLRGSYEVRFADIVSIELLPFSAAQLASIICDLQIPVYQPVASRPGFRITMAGYFRGSRLHVHLNPDSSYTIWITRLTGTPVLISRSSNYQTWIEQTYQHITRQWHSYIADGAPQYDAERIEEVNVYKGIMPNEESLHYEAARLGDAQSQWYLGLNYFSGTDIVQDSARAVYWLTKAAEQGHVEAQSNLGWVYLMDENVQDYVQAIYWTRKAAESGELGAQATLGHMYALGRGTEINHDAALYWFRLAAEANFRYAEFNMGTMYEGGLGVDINLEQALYWFTRSAVQGHPEGILAYERLLEYLE